MKTRLKKIIHLQLGFYILYSTVDATRQQTLTRSPIRQSINMNIAGEENKAI
jgi:hypothetical protein